MSEGIEMAKCSRCGKAMGNASVCPHCGYGPSQSVVAKTVQKAVSMTGKALETGVMVSDTVYKEVKPAVKNAVNVTKKGAARARDETLRVAKSLKEREG